MKNVKNLVSLALAVLLVATLCVGAFGSQRFKTDVVSDWQQGILNDISSGKRKLGQEPALLVTPASSQKEDKAPVAAEVIEKEELKEGLTVEAPKAATTKAPVTTTKAPVVNKEVKTYKENGYVNEWQQAILDDLSTGARKVGQKAPIVVHEDTNVVYKPAATTYDYIAYGNK